MIFSLENRKILTKEVDNLNKYFSAINSSKAFSRISQLSRMLSQDYLDLESNKILTELVQRMLSGQIKFR